MVNTLDSASTRPYLIRALYEWCTDNGLTPYVAVAVDDTVVVPREYVRDGEIVLNISFDATSALKLGNEAIEFKARFAGVARDIMVPVGRVMAVYARENGQGMAFPMLAADSSGDGRGNNKAEPKECARPTLVTRVPDVSKGEPDESNVVPLSSATDGPSDNNPSDDGQPPRPPSGSRPALKRIK